MKSSGDEEAELAVIGERLSAADAITLAELGTTCCYAHSDKFWAEDPQGVPWETFRTLGDSTTYSGNEAKGDPNTCCGPATSSTAPQTCGPKSAGICC